MNLHIRKHNRWIVQITKTIEQIKILSGKMKLFKSVLHVFQSKTNLSALQCANKALGYTCKTTNKTIRDNSETFEKIFCILAKCVLLVTK